MKKVSIAIFASGTGSNAKKIIEYFQKNQYISVNLVVSNKKDAPVLEMARLHGVDTLVIDRNYFYESKEILKVLQQYQTNLIVLAGFLWLAPAYLVNAFPRRIINIHPALLPKYGGKGMYGMRVHEAVKASGDPQTGITIHFVNEQYDEGNIIFQQSCSVEPGDTPDDIARKVHQLEHRYFPKVIEDLLKME